jgi:hypothetical protein
MPMHTPSKWIFILALVLAVLAVIGAVAHVQYLTTYAVWLAVAGWALLSIGCMFKTA